MVLGEMVGRARCGVRGLNGLACGVIRGLNGLACGAGKIRKLVSLG